MKLLTIQEAADRLGLRPATIRAWAQALDRLHQAEQVSADLFI
jgi:DNA-binding transcriptional MerR regulator